MKTKNRKRQRLKKRLFRSYLTTTVSIALVLLLAGIMALLALNAGKLSDYVRENIGLTLFLNEQATDNDVARLQKMLDTHAAVKSCVYVDKETAAQQLQEELGEDFQGFLGFNPLLASMDVKLNAAYTHPDSLALLELGFMRMPQVKEVYYQRDVMKLINDNVQKIGMVLVVLALLLLFIFSALINNAIRISIFSQRFIINTMQLVGATRGFIRRPFVAKSMWYGFLGALLANGLIAALVFTYRNEFGDIFDLFGPEKLALTFGLVFLLGAFLSWVSTFMAVNKFLRLKFDELF